MNTLAACLLVLALSPDAAVEEEALSRLTAGPQGAAIPQRALTTKWWCRGMVCVSSLPDEGDVCAGIGAVNKGPCKSQEKAHVLRAHDLRQDAEVILVLTTASICANQLRRWKKDANLRDPVCQVATAGDFFGVNLTGDER